jgi:hypothetical protein
MLKLKCFPVLFGLADPEEEEEWACESGFGF